MHKLPQGSFTDVPVDSWRAAAAQRVAQHKATTPHTYTTASCTLDRVFELGYRDHHLTAFLVKAAALTVQVGLGYIITHSLITRTTVQEILKCELFVTVNGLSTSV